MLARTSAVLVEFDTIPKDKQYQIFTQSGLPITALIDSGGKSIHAWIKVDAKNFEEFKQRRDVVYEYLGAVIDDQNDKNPSRYSRLLGVRRDGKMQQLVELNVGAESYDAWYESVEPRLFEIEDMEEMLINPPELPPVQIEGWLHRGHIGSITGAMKSNKSWTVQELAICTAMGRKWLDRDRAQARVMYFDAEVEKPFCQAMPHDLRCDRRRY